MSTHPGVQNFFRHNHTPEQRRTFKVGDRVQTRDGRKARVIADDIQCDDLRWIVAVIACGKYEKIALYLPTGSRQFGGDPRPDDLVHAACTIKLWLLGKIVDPNPNAEGRPYIQIYHRRPPGNAKTNGWDFEVCVEIAEGQFDA